MSQDFWIGFITGFFVAAVLGWFWWTLYTYGRQARAWNRPQLVIQPTQQTPEQVYLASMRAKIRMALLRILVLFYIVGVAATLIPEVRQAVVYLVSVIFNSAQ